MNFLHLLESMRPPFGDAFFSAVTHLGKETLFIVIGLLFFWCINKREGYYLLAVGLIGTVLNQFLRLVFRIPRPWVRDSSLTIAESARAEATGYSFPSGHTQTSVGVYGGIVRWNKQLWVRVICVVSAARDHPYFPPAVGSFSSRYPIAHSAPCPPFMHLSHLSGFNGYYHRLAAATENFALHLKRTSEDSTSFLFL